MLVYEGGGLGDCVVSSDSQGTPGEGERADVNCLALRNVCRYETTKVFPCLRLLE